MSDDIPLFEIAWGREEVQNVVDSVTRGSFWANGPYIEEFEERLEEYFDVENAVVFNSGTTALVSVLEAYGIGPGDEVVVPSFTFVSTANAVRLVGADPVFADIEPERYGLAPQAVREAITDDTVAILPVHYAGKPCRISRLREIAEENDLRLIEDAAEAFGALHRGKKVGTIGDAGMLSFCQNKVITTGEGGAIVTDDDHIAERLELLRSHGRSSSGYFESASGGEYTLLGSNYRMPDVTAGIGAAQMTKAEDLISRRRRAASLLSEGLKDVPGVSVPTNPENGRHVYQLYTVTLDESVPRDRVIRALSESGIASKVYFDPVHETQYYQDGHGRIGTSLETTVTVSKRVLSLPMSPNRTVAEADRITDTIADAVAEVR